MKAVLKEGTSKGNESKAKSKSRGFISRPVSPVQSPLIKTLVPWLLLALETSISAAPHTQKKILVNVSMQISAEERVFLWRQDFAEFSR